ncbi:DUF6053 domain-containing protein [Lysobacter enzymogenes]
MSWSKSIGPEGPPTHTWTVRGSGGAQ